MTAPALKTLSDVRQSTRATLTLTEAAAILGVNPRTVSAAAISGEVPCVRLGRRVLIPREAFIAMIDGGRAVSAR